MNRPRVIPYSQISERASRGKVYRLLELLLSKTTSKKEGQKALDQIPSAFDESCNNSDCSSLDDSFAGATKPPYA